MTKTTSFPEDVLIAVLHKVGPRVRIADDQRLASLFDDAAAESKGNLAQFRSHPQYHYSDILSEALATLDLGGSIERKNAATKYFHISAQTAGAYGKRKFAELDSKDKAEVAELAKRLRDDFA